MTKRIVLCADDYGQAEAVSSGILELLAMGRLTAVSCLVNMPGWKPQAEALKPYLQKADVGLHLNFTEGKPLSEAYRQQIGEQFMPLSRVLMHAVFRTRTLRKEALTAEIEAQVEAFRAAIGVMPRFIDGHQHVQHLPVIREALFAVSRKKFRGQAFYLRVVTQEIGLVNFSFAGLKNLVIHFTGGGAFAKRCDDNGIRHNTSFQGIYHFPKADQYRHLMQAFLEKSADRGLIMCHPGLANADIQDAVSHARVLEHAYLKSPQFIEDCERFNVKLTRFEL